MRNIVFLGFIALVIFLTLGWFLDWYSFTNVKSENGKVNIQFQVDSTKIRQDVSKGEKKFEQRIEQLKKDPPAKPAEAKPASQSPSWFN